MPGKRKADDQGGTYKKPRTYYGRRRYSTYALRSRFGDVSGVEQKFFDTAASNTSISTSGTIVKNSLNLLSQGSADNALNGRKCVVKSITCRMSARKVGDSGSSTQVEGPAYVRLALVLDTQCNAAAAAIANIYDVVATNGILSLKNMDNNKRFKIIRDWVVPMYNQAAYTGTANTFANPDARVACNDYIKCNIPLNFKDAATGLISDVSSNNLLLVGFASSDGYSVDYNIRIRFLDS